MGSVERHFENEGSTPSEALLMATGWGAAVLLARLATLAGGCLKECCVTARCFSRTAITWAAAKSANSAKAGSPSRINITGDAEVMGAAASDPSPCS